MLGVESSLCGASFVDHTDQRIANQSSARIRQGTDTETGDSDASLSSAGEQLPQKRNRVIEGGFEAVDSVGRGSSCSWGRSRSCRAVFRSDHGDVGGPVDLVVVGETH